MPSEPKHKVRRPIDGSFPRIYNRELFTIKYKRNHYDVFLNQTRIDRRHYAECWPTYLSQYIEMRRAWRPDHKPQQVAMFKGIPSEICLMIHEWKKWGFLKYLKLGHDLQKHKRFAYREYLSSQFRLGGRYFSGWHAINPLTARDLLPPGESPFFQRSLDLSIGSSRLIDLSVFTNPSDL